jgi:hypothetical protein
MDVGAMTPMLWAFEERENELKNSIKPIVSCATNANSALYDTGSNGCVEVASPLLAGVSDASWTSWIVVTRLLPVR